MRRYMLAVIDGELYQLGGQACVSPTPPTFGVQHKAVLRINGLCSGDVSNCSLEERCFWFAFCRVLARAGNDRLWRRAALADGIAGEDTVQRDKRVSVVALAESLDGALAQLGRNVGPASAAVFVEDCDPVADGGLFRAEELGDLGWRVVGQLCEVDDQQFLREQRDLDDSSWARCWSWGLELCHDGGQLALVGSLFPRMLPVSSGSSAVLSASCSLRVLVEVSVGKSERAKAKKVEKMCSGSQDCKHARVSLQHPSCNTTVLYYILESITFCLLYSIFGWTLCDG
jgi:hypothetical protein